MKHYGRMIAGVVVEIKDLPGDFDIEALFGPEHGFVSLPAKVEAGWLQDGAKFVAPPNPTLDQASILAGLKAEAGQTIGAVISTAAQLNLNAAMNVITTKLPAERSDDDRAFARTFAEGHAWIQAVRARIPVLMKGNGETPRGEERWPMPSSPVVDLARRY